MNLRAIALFICISMSLVAPAVCEEGSDWLKIKSDYLTIEYENSVDLKAVVRRLNERGIFSGDFFSSAPPAVTWEERLAQRLDGLLKKAEETLDMYPPKLKLTIKIFKSEQSLGQAYFKMFNERKDYEAFYVYQYATIYTSESGMSDSVIIHEMAHAVIDNYFSANPPSRVSEILAQYVDTHLAEL